MPLYQLFEAVVPETPGWLTRAGAGQSLLLVWLNGLIGGTELHLVAGHPGFQELAICARLFPYL